MADAMKALRDEGRRPAAAALLAVHSAIAFNDTLSIRLTGKAFKGQDHQQATDVTQRKCAELKLESKSLKNLRELISNKNYVSYSDKNLESIKVDRLCEAADRFRFWVEQVLGRKL